MIHIYAISRLALMVNLKKINILLVALLDTAGITLSLSIHSVAHSALLQSNFESCFYKQQLTNPHEGLGIIKSSSKLHSLSFCVVE